MNKVTQPTLTIDGKTVAIEGERNLLELVRKANIDLPTFCYHSELSVYGACRLCLVQIEGRGIQGACSTPPEPGLKIQTTTPQIREIRKIAVDAAACQSRPELSHLRSQRQTASCRAWPSASASRRSASSPSISPCPR